MTDHLERNQKEVERLTPNRCWSRTRTIENNIKFVYQCMNDSKYTFVFNIPEEHKINICEDHSSMLKPYAIEKVKDE